MNNPLVTLIAASAFMFGCGNIERSVYKPSPDTADITKVKPKTRNTDDGKKNEKKEDENGNPVEETPIELDLTYDTGLQQCIKDQIVEEFGSIFAPIKLSINLGDYLDKNISSYEEFENVSDAIIREVVDTNGLVDYQKLRTTLNPQWKKVIEALKQGSIVLPPSGEEETEAMVFWTNTYNLLMIDFIVNAPGTKNITKDLGFPIFDKKIDVAGIKLSLNDIEKGVLSLAGSTNPAPEVLKVKTVEPRLHFTLVCGAISCPKLRNTLYRTDSFEKVLRENSLSVANDNSFFAIDSEGFAKYSGLFAFFPMDFELLYGPRFSRVSKYMLPGCRSDIAELQSLLVDPDLSYDDNYNWDLNGQ